MILSPCTKLIPLSSKYLYTCILTEYNVCNLLLECSYHVRKVLVQLTFDTEKQENLKSVHIQPLNLLLQKQMFNNWSRLHEISKITVLQNQIFVSFSKNTLIYYIYRGRPKMFSKKILKITVKRHHLKIKLRVRVRAFLLK